MIHSHRLWVRIEKEVLKIISTVGCPMKILVNAMMNSFITFSKTFILVICLILLSASAFAQGPGFSQNLGELNLSDEEKAWLKENPVIKVAPDLNYAPIEFLDTSDDKVKGIAIDYLEWIEEHYPIKFMIMRYPTWNHQLNAIRDKKVDLLSAAARTPSRSSYMDFTEPYVLTPNVILRRSDQPAIIDENNLEGLKVGAVGGYAVQEFMKIRYENINMNSVDSIEEGLNKIVNGELDAFICEYYVASYYLGRLQMTDIVIETNMDVGFPQKLAMASRNDAPLLASILDKMLKTIPPSEKQAIEAKWIGGYESLSGLKTILKYLVVGVVISVAIASSLVLTSLYLKRKVKEQTTELEQLNQSLEDKVERRTYLLSETNKQLELSMYELQMKEEELARLNLELEASMENLKQSQDRLVEIQKVAALGNLVSTVAHELNTPLGNIMTTFTFYMTVIEKTLVDLESSDVRTIDLEELTDITKESKQIITNSLERLNELIIRFKALAVKTSSSDAVTFDLSSNLAEWFEILTYTHPFKFEIHSISEGEEVGRCELYGSKDLFQEIFDNLVFNSFIHGRRPELDEPLMIHITLEKSMNRFRIHYCDNGPGVDEDTASRMLEPLFSTKKMSGIGMSIVANIVHYAFEGDLSIRSQNERKDMPTDKCPLTGFSMTMDMPIHKLQDSYGTNTK